MTQLRRPDHRYCPAGAHWVPASHMKVHEGKGRYVELEVCKACQCSSRIASALGVARQGRA